MSSHVRVIVGQPPSRASLPVAVEAYVSILPGLNIYLLRGFAGHSVC